MSDKHTQGRLVVKGGFSIYTEDGGTPVADASIHSTHAQSEADARRLTACWNACAGISTESMESGPTMMAAYQREQDRADTAEISLERMRVALEIIAAGNTDPDDMVRLAQEAVDTVKTKGWTL